MTDVTGILNTIEQGDARTADELVRLAYMELRVPESLRKSLRGNLLEPIYSRRANEF
jgi:hypothetical protein